MNVCRSVGHVSSCPCTQAQHNIHWLRPFYNSPTCPTLPRPVGKTLWKMCCLAGANDNDNKHASSPEVRNFLTWLQRSIAKYTTLHRNTPSPPPLYSSWLARPRSRSWRIFPYNSFICPSIHFENVNSCASSLFDYSCFISILYGCLYVCLYVNFPKLSSYLSRSWGWLFTATFHFGSASRFHFHFRFVSFFFFKKIAW